MSFQCVLVPIDVGGDNRRAVEIAAELASAQVGGRLELLHVIETIDDEPVEEAGDFYAPLEESARQVMEELVDGLGGADSAPRPPAIGRSVVYGRRLAEILSFAAECGAHVIVVRSHRVEPGRPGGGVGTLSHEIALLAEIPVLLVK